MISRLPADLAVWAALAWPVFAQAPAGPPLVLEEKIALPKAGGRIDHMDTDLARKYLFVSEVGNGSVDIVDLKQHTHFATRRDSAHREILLND